MGVPVSMAGVLNPVGSMSTVRPLVVDHLAVTGAHLAVIRANMDLRSLMVPRVDRPVEFGYLRMTMNAGDAKAISIPG